MQGDRTGAELLLSEPEIVAWLGLDDKRNDVQALQPGQSPARPAGGGEVQCESAIP